MTANTAQAIRLHYQNDPIAKKVLVCPTTDSECQIRVIFVDGEERQFSTNRDLVLFFDYKRQTLRDI